MTAPGSIRARGVGFRYDGQEAAALHDISFDLAPGSTLLVLGPSGSGKSTLALAIAGLIPRERPGDWSGRLEVSGVETSKTATASHAGEVGVLFQDADAQLVHERVEDDVAFGLENLGWSREAMAARVPETLESAGALRLRNARTTLISGGEQQRVALAGVLAPRPPVLVLDEPTSNLDPEGARSLAAQLAALRDAGTTLVLVEHRVELVWHLADRVLALDARGALRAFGAPSDVLRDAGRALEADGVWLPIPAPGVRRRSDRSEAPFVLEAHGLRYAYPAAPPAVDGASLRVRAGERIALVGRNGSGKSTLGRLLVGLLRPAHGRVDLLGAAPHRMAPALLARRAGYVFQDPERGFLATRVRHELGLGLTAAEAAALPALTERLGLPLETFGDRSPYELSGGEQRRLSLAVALARQPQVLVLDEPTWGQDRNGYGGLLEIIRERSTAGTAILFATHDEQLVSDAADRVLRLECGRLVEDG